FAGELVVRGLNFSYDGVTPVLTDVNFTLAPGEHGAIIGPTGGGKTTLINLIMRHYQPPRGTIFIDGNDILDIDIAHLRRCIGMVPQQPWIRGATVRENIRLGREGATDDEIIAAARAAHAHDFISCLKDGYDTMLSADGDTLSAGQLQLVCIARTILAAPDMLILDEAVSSVDRDTEVAIQKAIATLMKGRTSIIIAHRPTFVESADKVVEIGVKS
ncbi:MAG: ATP-binding cassette domain-containing protein, partial [Oscillospiraceae bacterium]|nr:ATP-binding cassette domain-containing protein [Oscillospiraceae bacterium]